MRLFDNTRTSDHRTCNRYFYYRHVRHLDTTTPRAPLAFGLAWHAAMDVMWREIFDGNTDVEGIARAAYTEWEREWIEQGMPDPLTNADHLWADLKARTPDNAAKMILAYIKERGPLLKRDLDLLAIEQPFIVPLDPEDPDLMYCGRLDKVVRRSDGIWILDHKTTSAYRKDQGFASYFTDSFSPDSQMDGYAFGGHMLYGDEFKGILIEGALVHKTQTAFGYIPIKRDAAHLDAWLWETREEIRRIEQNKAALEKTDIKSLTYLPAFPKSTKRCYDYFSPCVYLDFCKMWSHPERHLEVRPGFVERKWSPFDHIQLEKIGLTREEGS